MAVAAPARPVQHAWKVDTELQAGGGGGRRAGAALRQWRQPSAMGGPWARLSDSVAFGPALCCHLSYFPPIVDTRTRAPHRHAMTASGSASPNAQDAGRPADALHADPRTAPPRAAPLRPGAPPVTLAPGIRVDDCLLPAMSALTVPFALPRAVTAASACALTSTTQGSGPGGGAVVRRDQHLPPAAPSTSAGAAITRSLLLFLGA